MQVPLMNTDPLRALSGALAASSQAAAAIAHTMANATTQPSQGDAQGADSGYVHTPTGGVAYIAQEARQIASIEESATALSAASRQYEAAAKAFSNISESKQRALDDLA